MSLFYKKKCYYKLLVTFQKCYTFIKKMLLKIFSNIYVNVSVNKYKCYKK